MQTIKSKNIKSHWLAVIIAGLVGLVSGCGDGHADPDTVKAALTAERCAYGCKRTAMASCYNHTGPWIDVDTARGQDCRVAKQKVEAAVKKDCLILETIDEIGECRQITSLAAYAEWQQSIYVQSVAGQDAQQTAEVNARVREAVKAAQESAGGALDLEEWRGLLQSMAPPEQSAQ